MSELKTLKDLETNREFGEQVVFKEDLRAEAVKWVKELEGVISDDEMHYASKWVKHFFNLIEEDLE